jgi:restriction endonuclease S subunit
MTRLGDVAKMGSGSGWKSSDERLEAGSGRLRVLGITNTPPGGAITLDQVKYVEDLPVSTPRLSESSLLMIRTNGNRKRIGNVYRIPPEARDCAFSAFQIGLHFGSREEANFAYWMLSESLIQSQISLAASGSTGLGNVAITWLRKLEIPWPASDASRITVIAGRNLQDSYVEMRSRLLSQLLSGNHEIAVSYDSILEVAW